MPLHNVEIWPFCKNAISSLKHQETSVRGASREEGGSLTIYPTTLLVCQTISKNYLAFFRLVIPETNASTPPPTPPPPHPPTHPKCPGAREHMFTHPKLSRSKRAHGGHMGMNLGMGTLYGHEYGHGV